MRALMLGVSLLVLAGCSKVEESRSMEAADSAAPGVNVTAAPGVAFDYRYAFRPPAEKISATQEAHAQACEKLGVARCRITGMRYTLTGADRVDASLNFKLDPALARGFGRQGIAAVVAADGMLTDAEITGTDAGAAIERRAAQQAQLSEERTRLDRELAKPDLKAAERAELQRQRAALDEQTRTVRSDSADQRASLATTPVTFQYETGRATRAFGTGNVFIRAFDTAVESASTTFGVLLAALALLGPPGLALLGIWLLYRWIRRRWFPTVAPV